VSIELRPSEVEHVYAWVVAHAAPQHVIVVFYRNKDEPELHIQWRLATKEEPDRFGMDRKKTFKHFSRDIDDHHHEIQEWSDKFAASIGASSPYLYPVDGDVDAAMRVLDSIPGVEGAHVH
jgi:hypothetical protein